MNDYRCDWFAVYTRPRQEHIALRNLERQSFKCYLPLADTLARSSRRPCGARREPLFPRYLFLNVDAEVQSLAPVRSTRGIVDLVRAGFELVRVPAEIIDGLMRRTNPATGLIALNPIVLHKGDKVRVRDGPFANMEGVFEEQRGPTRSLLLLQMIGSDCPVEINARSLQRVC